jgi:hypothetical protein
MGQKKIFAVLTGDLVKSALFQSQRNEVLSYLKKILITVEEFEKESDKFIIFTEIFRGDSFQGVISNPHKSLKVALFIRAELLKKRIKKEQVDAKIAIGLGTIESLSREKIEESDGEAFQYSGRALDRMKKSQRISILSFEKKLNKNFNLLTSLLDTIISRWSPEQAEAVALWIRGETQKSISKILGISQPAVHKRLKIAGVSAIEDSIGYFESTVKDISL